MAVKALQKLLSFPSFCYSLFVFYWSLPIFAVAHKIRFLKMKGARNDMLDWGKCLRRFFNVSMFKYGAESLYKGGNCIYLCNHRSWADFFIDTYLTEGRSALMSRWLVFFVFPIFCTAVVALNGIILFKRGTVIDKNKFNAWLDRKRAASFIPGLIVYPEGHRSLNPKGLPLKRGMLHYAFGRKIPIQILISRGKEQILSEKTLSVHFGSTVVVGFSKIIEPKDFEKFEDFFTKIQNTWDELWENVYASDAKALPPFAFAEEQSYNYSTVTRLLQGAFTVLSLILLALALKALWLLLSLVLVAAGPAQQLLVGVVAAWVAASFWNSRL